MTKLTYTLLLIEDDIAILDMLSMYLKGKNYRLLSAINGKQALQHLQQTSPDLLLLDWMLPDTNGIQLIKQIRKMDLFKDLPILMLTARAQEMDKIKGLETGADDYMTKPVSLAELNARIHALIRRAQGLNSQKKISYDGIILDPEKRQVEINHQILKMGRSEYQLLYFLMKNPARLYTRNQLLDHVWGQNIYIEERTVDVHIMRLRKILKKYQKDKILKTVRGVGYQLIKSPPYAIDHQSIKKPNEL